MAPPSVFTHEDLIACPRPKAAIPSPNGTLAILIVDQWDPATDITSRSVCLISLPLNGQLLTSTSPITLFTCSPQEVGSFFWLSEEHIAYFEGQTIKYSSLSLSGGEVCISEKRVLLTFPEGIGASLLTFERTNGLLAFRAQVWENNGEFEDTAQLDEKKAGAGSAVRYDEVFIRFKDEWRVPGKVYTVGLVKLEQDGVNWKTNDIDGKQFYNVLKGTGLYSQVPAFQFALSPSHVAVAIRPPKLNPALSVRFDVYIFPLNITHATYSLTALPVNLNSGHNHGEVELLVTSKDGSKIAWTEREIELDEASKRNIFVWDRATGKKQRWCEEWDVFPSQINLSHNGESLYCVAETNGRLLPYHLSGPEALPTQLYHDGCVDTLTVLDDERILLFMSTMLSPHHDILLTHYAGANGAELVREIALDRLTDYTSCFIGHKIKCLEREEFWFEGDEGVKMMGWIGKPKDWKQNEDNEKVYPLAFLIHGGPASAFRDWWNIRWNALLYAAQGYVVMACNQTGSTGYGQKFIDDFRSENGKRPLNDLEKGLKAAFQQFPQIDPERCVAPGASAGGQFIHLINGHTDRFNFKAMVAHAAIFDATTMAYETEELWLSHWESGIDPNTSEFKVKDCNPADFVDKMTTPTLISHGGRDFRVPESNSVCAFTVLQWRGIPSRLLRFPDESHKVEKPANMRQWYDEVFGWLEQLVGRPSNDQEEHSVAAEAKTKID
ncbi:hypothetical protein IAT40_006007 [Kwoniella sp. CBS 6097]